VRSVTRYRFDQIAENSTAKKKPEDSDRERYVGLEHLDPGTLEVIRWGAEVTPKGDKLLMERGDVLFGRRRAYQKKVGIAPFDGIFSAHGMVLRPRTDVVDPDFFPFFISSDVFLDEAIRVSVGSLSPTANWKDLKVLEFSLPTLDKQRELAGILSEAEHLKGCYRGLLATCDDVVKSQFVEMFEGKEYPSSCLSTLVSSMRNGLSPSKSGSHRSKVLTLSAITQGRFDSSAWKDGFFTEEPPADKRISNEDFYVCRGNGNKHLVGTGEYSNVPMKDMVFPDTMIAARIKQEQIILPYLRCAWNQPSTRKQIEASAKTTNGTFKINQTALGNIKLLVPPLELQQEFADFATSVDKSKFAVQKALDELNATTKKILNQELGLGDV
jgi:type I restriction enzyme S subunit